MLLRFYSKYRLKVSECKKDNAYIDHVESNRWLGLLFITESIIQYEIRSLTIRRVLRDASVPVVEFFGEDRPCGDDAR